MSSLTTLRTKTRGQKIKIDPNSKIFSDSVLDGFINDAYFQIQKDWGFRWRENYDNTEQSSTAGTGEYSLPSDFVKLDLIRYNGDDLKKTTKKELKIQNSSLTTQGNPYYYYIYGNVYGIYPLPDSTKTIDIDYFKRLPTITTSVDSDFPIDFDNAIACYAAYLAFLSINKNDKAVSMYTAYVNWLDTLINAYIYDDVVDTKFGYQRTAYITREDVL